MERERILFSAFKPDNEITDDDKEMLGKLNEKFNCKCDKDPSFKFSCNHGVKWFLSNTIIAKIKRKQYEETPGETPGGENIAVTTILEEYAKCKSHYKSLC